MNRTAQVWRWSANQIELNFQIVNPFRFFGLELDSVILIFDGLKLENVLNYLVFILDYHKYISI